MTGRPQSEWPTFVVKRCTCGHTAGQHQSSGPRGSILRAPRMGLCLVAGCDCRELVEPADDTAWEAA